MTFIDFDITNVTLDAPILSNGEVNLKYILVQQTVCTFGEFEPDNYQSPIFSEPSKWPTNIYDHCFGQRERKERKSWDDYDGYKHNTQAKRTHTQA